jgi:hypothetical protein
VATRSVLVPYGPNVTRPRKQDLDLEALLCLLRNSGTTCGGDAPSSVSFSASPLLPATVFCAQVSLRAFFCRRPFRFPALASSSSGRLAASIFCRHIAPVSKNLLSLIIISKHALFYALLRLKERERTTCSMLFVITIVAALVLPTLHFATTN